MNSTPTSPYSMQQTDQVFQYAGVGLGIAALTGFLGDLAQPARLNDWRPISSFIVGAITAVCGAVIFGLASRLLRRCADERIGYLSISIGWIVGAAVGTFLGRISGQIAFGLVGVAICVAVLNIATAKLQLSETAVKVGTVAGRVPLFREWRVLLLVSGGASLGAGVLAGLISPVPGDVRFAQDSIVPGVRSA